MRAVRFFQGSMVFATLLLHASVWADAFVEFFAKQKVGQEITVTGGFHKFGYKRHFYQRDHKTGEVQYFDYFGMSMVPTTVIGDGALSIKASLFDTMLFVYVDEALVEDLPQEGENIWFTGTLIGYQYGSNGITSGALSGGDPYILLKHVSKEPPHGLNLLQPQNPRP